MAPVFLDTTIHVDRVIEEFNSTYQAKINAILSNFDIRVTAGFSRLEFKRVVLQGLGLVLKYLAEEQSYFGALQRCTHLIDRRSKTLVNIAAWVGHKVNGVCIEGSALDEEMRVRSEAYIRNAIMFIWYKFEADITIANQMNCQRALEAPVKKGDGTYDLVIHEAQCRKKQCNNANFFQSQLPVIKKLCTELDRLKAQGQLTAELEKALATMKSAVGNYSQLQDYQTCLAVGDIWIHLEAVRAGVKDFMTTNHKESTTLCSILQLNLHNPKQAPTAVPAATTSIAVTTVPVVVEASQVETVIPIPQRRQKPPAAE